MQVSSKSAFKNKKRKEAAKAARLAEAAIPAQTCCINNNKNIVQEAGKVEVIGRYTEALAALVSELLRRLHAVLANLDHERIGEDGTTECFSQCLPRACHAHC